MTNIKNNDAEFCGKVPLHQTNLIQPHGFLLVIDRQTLEIVQGSENVNELLGVSIKDALKTPLTKYVPEEQAIQLQQRFDGTVTSRIPFVFTSFCIYVPGW
jgi:light-regulated signal transduction histidine kinase (bacteriophytochrome)